MGGGGVQILPGLQGHLPGAGYLAADILLLGQMAIVLFPPVTLFCAARAYGVQRQVMAGGYPGVTVFSGVFHLTGG